MKLELPEELATKIASLNVLSLGLDDRLAVKIDDDISASAEELHRIKCIVEDWAKVPVIVMAPGMSIEVMRPCPT